MTGMEGTSAMDGSTGGGGGPDLRWVGRPPNFDGSHVKWSEWRFKFANYLALADANLMTNLEQIERQTTPVVLTNEGRHSGNKLYALIASVVRGRALVLIKAVTERNGYEAWRLLVKEFEPNVAQRRLALLNALLSPDLSGNDNEFGNKWRTWESKVKEYESMTGEALDPNMKLAIVMKVVPVAARAYLQVNAHLFAGDYPKFATVLEGYLTSNQAWSAGGVGLDSSMDVDWIGSKKGSKGKGKTGKKADYGGGKNADADKKADKECFRCGKKEPLCT